MDRERTRKTQVWIALTSVVIGSCLIAACIKGTNTLHKNALERASAAQPHVAEVTPAQGAFTGGTPLTIKGKNFKRGATVTLGQGICSRVKVLDAETIQCIAPSHPMGSVSLTVMNPDGPTGHMASAFEFTDAISPWMAQRQIPPGQQNRMPASEEPPVAE